MKDILMERRRSWVTSPLVAIVMAGWVIAGGGRIAAAQGLTTGGACAAPDPLVACGTTAVRIPKRRTQTLAPGIYGAVRVQDAATLVLEGGDYTFCSLRVSRRAKLMVRDVAAVNVIGSATFSISSRTGPESGSPTAACDLGLFVGGREIVIQRRAKVSASVCAPAAKLIASRAATMVGDFVVNRVQEGSRVSVLPCPTTTTTTPGTTTTTL
jgi:hypothetical protein